MKKITLSPPAEGRVVSVPLMQSKVFTVSGVFEADNADRISVTVTADGQVLATSVDTNMGTFRSSITLTCPSVVAVKATLNTREQIERTWRNESTDSNIVTITLKDLSPDPLYLIICRNVDSGGRPLMGLQIEAFDEGPNRPDNKLGVTATTNLDGLAEFQFRESTFTEQPGGRYPNVYFRITRGGRPYNYDLPGELNDHGVLRNFQPRSLPVVIHVPDLRSYVVQGAILSKWLSLDAQIGLLGLPVTDELPTPDGRGAYNHFEGGSIYWTPDWGAFEVHGLIRNKWAELGWEQGYLGFPVTDELPMPGDKGGRYSLFEHGIITWEPGQTEALAAPHHYERIYADIRAQILSRHFAFGIKGRRNFLSVTNRLPNAVKDHPTTPDERKTAERARWHIIQNGEENPHLSSAYLHVALAIEHNAGNEESGRALEASLATLETLFTWKEPGAEDTSRLPTRWDPGIPLQVPDTRQFLDGGDGAYSNALPASNLHHYAKRSRVTLENLMGPTEATIYEKGHLDYVHGSDEGRGRGNGFRPWELSKDELTGLITSCWIIGKLSRSPGLTETNRRQASYLGNYLANHGYILVRPMGGLSWRGSSEELPALEHPFSRALSAVTGEDYTPRTDFRGAMIRAGYWPLLEGPIANAKLLAGLTLPFVFQTFGPLGLTLANLQAILAGQVLSQETVASFFGVLLGSDCFDVVQQHEPAVALLYRDAPNKAGLYHALAITTTIAANQAQKQAPSNNFHSWIGLTGVDDADPTVRATFAEWFAFGLLHPNVQGSHTLFAAGVAALVMNDTPTEANLVARLEREIIQRFRASYFEPRLRVYSEDPFYVETCEEALDLMAATALAFWHARRRADAGNPVSTARFPQPLSAGSFAHWPKAVVPAYCLTELQNLGTPIPMAKDLPDLNPFEPPRFPDLPDVQPVVGDYVLFDAPVPPRNPAPVPPPWEIADRILYDDVIPVRADYPGDVATGVILYPGCEIEISANGDIWSGIPHDPRNDPEGLPRLINDARWPLHTGIDPAAKAYCLLGRLNGYFRIGLGLPQKTRWVYFEERPLFLRINHVAPGYGNGQFNVHIKVWGPARMDPSKVFPPRQSLYRVGGVLRTTDPKDLIEVTVVKGAVENNAVEFQLTTPDGITWQKEIVIGQGSTDRDRVTILTRFDRHEDHNGLYLHQLPGATLTFNKGMDIFGVVVRRVLVLGGLESAEAGSRITFNWYYD